MIDEEKTFREKGYYSTDLSFGSGKPVYAICEGYDCEREGGRGRWVVFSAYHNLCHKCAIKKRDMVKEEDRLEKLPWVDDDITYAEKGYRSTDLSHGSSKPVWAICANPECDMEGGRGRWVEFRQCRELCRLCAHKGRKNSAEAIKKMSKNRKGKCTGKDNYMHNRNHSIETRILMSKNHVDFSGENNPAWKGGITPESILFRNSDEYSIWRIYVFKRDDYTCQECGDSTGGNLNAHHILPYRDWKDPRFSLNIKNGITLCKKCHDKTVWKEYEFFNKYFDIANGVGKYKK